MKSFNCLFRQTLKDNDKLAAAALKAGTSAAAFLNAITAPAHRASWPNGFKRYAINQLIKCGFTADSNSSRAKREQVLIYFDAPEAAALRDYCANNDRTLTSVVRDAVAVYLFSESPSHPLKK